MPGSPIARTPSHLVWRKNSLYYRARVPTDLCAAVGRSELRFCLGTAKVREARQAAGLVHLRLELLYNQLRKNVVTLTADQITRIIRNVIAKHQDEFKQKYLANSYDAGSIENEIYCLHSLIEDTASDVSCNDNSSFFEGADKILKEYQVDIDHKSIEYKNFCRELMIAHVQMWRKQIAFISGDHEIDYTQERPTLLPQQTNAMHQDAQATLLPKGNRPLSELVDGWLDSRRRTRPGSKEDYKDYIVTFVDVVDNINANQLTSDVIQNAKNAIERLPKHRNKKLAYRDRSIAELLKINIPKEDRYAEGTLVNMYDRVRSFIDWLCIEKYSTEEASRAAKYYLNIARKEKRQKKVASLTEEEFKLIFDADSYLHKKQHNDVKFWLPLLMMFTAARPKELCGLCLKDFILWKGKDKAGVDIDIELQNVPPEEDSGCGIWCFRIMEIEENQSVKNEFSARRTPISPKLIDTLKLIDYARARLKIGKQTFFDGVTDLDKFTDNSCDKVNRYIYKVLKYKSTVNGRKTFYSMRHSFSDWCKRNRINNDTLNWYAGRSVDGMA